MIEQRSVDEVEFWVISGQVGTTRDGTKYCNEHYIPLEVDKNFNWIYTCEMCKYPLEE